ncbi:MAG TPA: hypothetical protein VNW04_00085 [Puia sp.]|jgi:hypothetical protein|nr:hypothetical protein [Puia sp.]
MPETTLYKEKQFIDQLSEQLSQGQDWKVETETDGGSTDLIVRDPHSGKRIFIEFQEGGQYGELPISSILSLNKQKSRLLPSDLLLLVTFSGIPALLASKLKELGILAFTRPSVEEVVGQVRYAMSA